ncbi:hypothetical protein TresaDRAFT_2070 [Treponema saccharophilum DSM 2985]|uniref:Uncharacterized protein n=1 Tax=Treponema saccharophilum DSM 2985 TaxID=907348 RepID=H7EIX1_9SPIR|nr:hypothetical protein TresaDRAFT_2070 [Treponema saccharophilum DSM 2985]
MLNTVASHFFGKYKKIKIDCQLNKTIKKVYNISKTALRAPAHACYNKADFRTRKAQQAQTPNGKIFITRPTPHRKVRHAHRRTLAPTKAELRTRKAPASAISERENHNHHAPHQPRKVRPAHRRTLATTKAELRTRNDQASAIMVKSPNHEHHIKESTSLRFRCRAWV